MAEWHDWSLRDVLHPIDERVGEQDLELVLSVTEKRGIIPQTEVFKKRIATKDVTKYKVLRGLDIAYNPYLLWMGAVGQWLGDRPGITSPVYETFRVMPPHEPRFVGLLLDSGVLGSYFDSTAVGSIQRRRRTTVPVFLAAHTSMPDPETQRRIVDLIGALDLQIDALNAEQVAATVLHKAWREALLAGHEQSALGSILVGIDAGKSPATTGEVPGDLDPAVLKVSAVGPLIFRPAEAKILGDAFGMSPDMEVKAGDLLITRANTPALVGAVCRVPAVVRPGLYLCDKTLRLRHDESVDAEFLAEALNSRIARTYLSGSASGTSASMHNLSQSKIKATPIPLLTLEAQRVVAERLGAVRQVAAALDEERRTLQGVRRVALDHLLSGLVEIPESYDSLLTAAV